MTEALVRKLDIVGRHIRNILAVGEIDLVEIVASELVTLVPGGSLELPLDVSAVDVPDAVAGRRAVDHHQDPQIEPALCS